MSGAWWDANSTPMSAGSNASQITVNICKNFLAIQRISQQRRSAVDNPVFIGVDRINK